MSARGEKRKSKKDNESQPSKHEQPRELAQRKRRGLSKRRVGSSENASKRKRRLGIGCSSLNVSTENVNV